MLESLDSLPSLVTSLDSLPLPSFVTSFADQGNNLAGIFFQASLLPYLSFIYFLNHKDNRTPPLGQFGFSFLLLFVLATIPSGIVSKLSYGDTLANVDWLHGSAEVLLTITNLLIVSGFRSSSVEVVGGGGGEVVEEGEVSSFQKLEKNGAFVAFGLFAVFCGIGTTLGFENHSAFLFGLGESVAIMRGAEGGAGRSNNARSEASLRSSWVAPRVSLLVSRSSCVALRGSLPVGSLAPH